jgi:hypothetical protein
MPSARNGHQRRSFGRHAGGTQFMDEILRSRVRKRFRELAAAISPISRAAIDAQ